MGPTHVSGWDLSRSSWIGNGFRWPNNLRTLFRALQSWKKHFLGGSPPAISVGLTFLSPLPEFVLTTDAPFSNGAGGFPPSSKWQMASLCLALSLLLSRNLQSFLPRIRASFVQTPPPACTMSTSREERGLRFYLWKLKRPGRVLQGAVAWLAIAWVWFFFAGEGGCAVAVAVRCIVACDGVIYCFCRDAVGLPLRRQWWFKHVNLWNIPIPENHSHR